MQALVLKSLSLSTHCALVVLCDNFHLLKEEVSLLKVQQYTDMNEVVWLLCSCRKIMVDFFHETHDPKV